MNKTTSRRHALQTKSVEKSRRKRRITRAFTPLPDGYLGTIPRRFQPFFVFLWSWNKGGPVTECYRVFAAKMGVHMTTVQRWAYGLEDLGHLRIECVKIGRCRNGANTFYFPKLDGFIVEEKKCRIAVEVLNETLNTNTNTTAPRASAPPVSYARLRWEHHRQRNHPPEMRALYEQNAVLIDENRVLRHRSHGREAWQDAPAKEWRGMTKSRIDELLVLYKTVVDVPASRLHEGEAFQLAVHEHGPYETWPEAVKQAVDALEKQVKTRPMAPYNREAMRASMPERSYRPWKRGGRYDDGMAGMNGKILGFQPVSPMTEEELELLSRVGISKERFSGKI